MFSFNGTYSWPEDLNDGAGGRCIYGRVARKAFYGLPIKEVAILSGSFSSIQPPSGWVKVNKDLNEGAGGKFIYFCFKK